MACSRPKPGQGGACLASEDAAPGYVPTSFRTCRSTPIPLSGPRCSRGACPHELGPAAQTSVRDRHRALPPVRWHLEDHRRHRASPRDQQDPHPSRFARPSTSGQGLRSIPTGRSPSHPVHPEPTLPLGPRPHETPNTPKQKRLGPMKGLKMPRSQAEDRYAPDMLDRSRAQQYTSRKRALTIPMPYSWTSQKAQSG